MARQEEQQWRFLGEMFCHPRQKVTGLQCGQIAVGDRVVVKRPTGVYTGAIVCEVNEHGHPTLIIDKSQTKKGPFEHPELSCFPLEAMTPWSNFQTPEKHGVVPPNAPRKQRKADAARIAVQRNIRKTPQVKRHPRIQRNIRKTPQVKRHPRIQRNICETPPVKRHPRSEQIPGMSLRGTWKSTSAVQGHGVDEPEALEQAIANSLRDFESHQFRRHAAVQAHGVDPSVALEQAIANSLGDATTPPNPSSAAEVIDLTD
jgi:hypothetical protein